MPHYHKYEWEGFNLSAKPLGMRRWWFFSWWPYFSGNEPTLKISITAKADEERPFEAHLKLVGSTGDEIRHWPFLSKLDSKPFTNVDKVLKLHPIAAGGDHSLQLHVILPLAKAAKSELYDLVTFRAIVQESLTLLVAAALFTLVGAVVGGLIVHFLSGG